MLKNASDEKLALLAKKHFKKYIYVLYMRYRQYGFSIIDSILRKTYYYSSLVEAKDEVLIESLSECIKDYKPNKGSFRNLLSAVLTHKTYKLVSKFSKDALADYISIDAIKIKGEMLFADSGSIGPISPSKVLEHNESKKDAVTSYCPNNRKIKYIIGLKDKGYTYLEIADKTNKSEKAIRQLFYRIRKRIKSDNSKY